METEYYDFSYLFVIIMLSLICGFVLLRLNNYHSVNYAGIPFAFVANVFRGLLYLIKYTFLSFIIILLLT